MPSSVQFDKFSGLKRLLSQSVDPAKLDSIASEIGNRFMKEIWAVQPVGGPDPMPGRNTRPSIRLGNKPIENGWLDSSRITRSGQNSRTIEVVSESPHVEFFTMWTGRPYLGWRPGRDIVAINAKSLAFWWMGSAHYQKVVPAENRRGSFPAHDFMAVAYGKTEPFIWSQIKDIATFTFDQMKYL